MIHASVSKFQAFTHDQSPVLLKNHDASIVDAAVGKGTSSRDDAMLNSEEIKSIVIALLSYACLKALVSQLVGPSVCLSIGPSVS